MAFLLIGSVVLGLAWILIFWVASFLGYIVAWIASLFFVQVHVDGENNIWYLFAIVCGTSWLSYHLAGDGCGLGAAIFVFLTGTFMLFRSADIWKIGTC